ncbi:hypothetical protein [Streptomyces sp. NPDC005181]|uniref:hypothetical protein n=1 Tax=Streptomyces sp. NPDC005181 TaxID=3156869 RepID=UPI0033B2E9FF
MRGPKCACHLTAPGGTECLTTGVRRENRGVHRVDAHADGPVVAAASRPTTTAQENLQLQAAPGTTSTAEFSVLDDHGKQVCSIYPSLSTWSSATKAVAR